MEAGHVDSVDANPQHGRYRAPLPLAVRNLRHAHHPVRPALLRRHNRRNPLQPLQQPGLGISESTEEMTLRILVNSASL